MKTYGGGCKEVGTIVTESRVKRLFNSNRGFHFGLHYRQQYNLLETAKVTYKI
jgi:hypothetical protein